MQIVFEFCLHLNGKIEYNKIYIEVLFTRDLFATIRKILTSYKLCTSSHIKRQDRWESVQKLTCFIDASCCRKGADHKNVVSNHFLNDVKPRLYLKFRSNRTETRIQHSRIKQRFT